MVRERITVRLLVDRAAQFTNIDSEHITGQRRPRNLCAIRCAIFIVARENGFSLPAIGERTGGRNHGTVIACMNAEKLYRLSYSQFDELLEALRTGHCEKRLRFGKAPRVPKKVTRQQWSEEHMQQIDQMMRNGVHRGRIAQYFDVSLEALTNARQRWLNRNRKPGERFDRKLCEADVIEIRRRIADGEGNGKIAADYNVTRTCINLIRKGSIWKHVPCVDIIRESTYA